MREDVLVELRLAIINGEAKKAREATVEAVESGLNAYEIFERGMAEAMRTVGEKYQSFEYFLPQLVLSGEAMKEGLNILDPLLQGLDEGHYIGKIIIGSVQGDVHDLGKNIVVAMFRAAGFEVKDLGIDVPTERFISELIAWKPDILAASAYISSTIHRLKEIADELDKRSLRRSVKYIVGGVVVTERYALKIGADGYAKNAMDAVEAVQQLLEREDTK